MGKAEPPDGRSGGQPGRFLSFWTTLPGILTGSAALITAVVSLLALFHAFGGSSGATGSTSGITSPHASTGETSAASLPEGVFRRGTLTMTGEVDYANLEQGVTGTGVSPSDITYVLGGFGYELHDARGIAPAPAGSGMIDKAACVRTLTVRQDLKVDVDKLSKGSQLCVQTYDSHVALLTIVSLPGVGNPNIVFDYVVWQ